MTDILIPPREQFLREDTIRGGMDLLFFAHTRHLQRADETLASKGLGRAHHRMMYFLARRPAQTVSALLATLRVTKQSLGRTAKELTERNLIESRTGEQDRRQRLLSLTPSGIALERELFEELHNNVERAYVASGSEAVAGFWTVMQHLIGEEGREQFRAAQQSTLTS